ncbi:MAG: hypothetical protein QOJ65_1985 [Fimbriimonadaceae bacterium]|jgi:hypothetical protein|nr:hypothetical protein [Fimbriimonadaceae bacterium]
MNRVAPGSSSARETPTSAEESASRGSVLKFVGVFAITFLILLVGYLALYRLVDPRSEYGTGVFPAPLANARVTKQSLFKEYNAGHKVDALILGSSRSMPFSADIADRVSGHSFFNFSVESAMAEDYLAVYRWARQQGIQPKIIVVGLDVEALHPFLKTDDRLVGSPTLYEALTGHQGVLANVGYALSRTSDKLTIQNAQALLKGIQLKLRPSAQTEIVQADGHDEYPAYEAQVRAGTFNLERGISTTLPWYANQYKDMSRLSKERKGRVAQLVREAVTDGVEVILWIPPLHPRTVKKLGESTPYSARLRETIEFAQELASAFPGKVHAYDLSSPDKFGGDDTDWRDGAHMNNANAERALRKLLSRDEHGL